MIPLVVAVAAIGLRRWWRGRRRVARADRGVADAVPELVELLVLLVRAGLTPVLAVRELASQPPPPFGPALGRVVARLDQGDRFGDAIGALVDELGAPLDPLVAVLVQAERSGEPLGPILDRLADDARGDRRRRNEIAARRLPVQLSVPLVCCTLPAFVVLTIVPMLIGTFSSLRRLRP